MRSLHRAEILVIKLRKRATSCSKSCIYNWQKFYCVMNLHQTAHKTYGKLFLVSETSL